MSCCSEHHHIRISCPDQSGVCSLHTWLTHGVPALAAVISAPLQATAHREQPNSMWPCQSVQPAHGDRTLTSTVLAHQIGQMLSADYHWGLRLPLTVMLARFRCMCEKYLEIRGCQSRGCTWPFELPEQLDVTVGHCHGPPLP